MYLQSGVILFLPQPQSDFNEFRYRLIHELSCWGSPPCSYAQRVHINVKLFPSIGVGGFVRHSVFGFSLNFKRPELACLGLHVLESAQPLINMLVQEDTGFITLSLQIEFADARLCKLNSIGSNDTNPLVKPEDYVISFTANATSNTVPRLNVAPWYGNQIIIPPMKLSCSG